LGQQRRALSRLDPLSPWDCVHAERIDRIVHIARGRRGSIGRRRVFVIGVQTGGSGMLKVLGIAVLVIFVIGLLVVIGAFDLIL
jgi:hypothetical protein